MFNFCKKAIEIADKRGVDFGDIRIIETRRRVLSVKNGEIGDMDDSVTLGFGVRILHKGAWGFASSDKINAEEIKKTTLKAIQIARASSMLKERNVKLAPEPAYRDFWQTPRLIDPFEIPMERSLELLFRIDSVLRKKPAIKSAVSSMKFVREHQWHMTTEGSEIEQDILSSGAGFFVKAVETGEVQDRSYPSTHGGQTLSMGYELMENLKLLDNAERVREEALALLKAKDCPQDQVDLIIGGNQLALQIHESVGHATELDRVLGYEESFAGSSFATTEKLGKFRYGSPIVNLVADATLPGGLATAGYDDDAVKAQRWHIVRDGVLSGYMTNREFAHAIGMNRSWGSNRAEGYDNIPITRICNLSLMPGKWELSDLIKDTKKGIIMENNRLWSIDQKRLNFQFGCEIGWLVENGRKTKIVKNPTYQGITPQFWNSCDAICNENHWQLWGVANCGKGQPMQTAMMCHANSPARFKKVKVGVKVNY
ncbi:MAG: TldD/PmbA family protein [Elusimicrobia bacterium]|nr:TldD/PmbA family protein [Elusimicrobiota bacterium]